MDRSSTEMEHDDGAAALEHSNGDREEEAQEINLGDGADESSAITGTALVVPYETEDTLDPAGKDGKASWLPQLNRVRQWVTPPPLGLRWPPTTVLRAAVVVLLLLVAGWCYFLGTERMMMMMRRRPVAAASVFRVRGSNGTTTAVDISQHGAWQKMETGIRRCIPSGETTDDGDIKSLFDDASAAHVDDAHHAMNRYLYLAIMHAVVLGSRFAADGKTTPAFVAGQKVGKDQVGRYLRTMLDSMQGVEITTSQDASAEFNQMNRYLYMTLVQASVLRNKYPPTPTQTTTTTSKTTTTQTTTEILQTQEMVVVVDEAERANKSTEMEEQRLRDKADQEQEIARRLREKDEEITWRLREKDEEVTRRLRDKDDEIQRLRDEVHRLRSGLDQCRETCEQRVAECHSQYKDCDAKANKQGLSYDEDY